MRQRNRYALAEPVAGAELLGAGEFFIVVPRGSVTNLISNPSVETATTGYTASGSSLARSASYQARGVYSLQVTPNNSAAGEGATFAVTLAAATQYAFSADVRGAGGAPYYIAIERTSDGRIMARYDFAGLGDWQRVYVIGETLGAGAYRVALRTNARSNRVFHTDGWMLQAGGRRETYVDGDQRGMTPNFQDYYWTGAPHASTSVRVANSSAGGEIVSLKSIGFHLFSILGLGLGGLANQLSPVATGGAFYQGTVISDRTFTLVGSVDGGGYLDLGRQRAELTDYVSFARVTPTQPLKLLYAPAEECGAPLGRTLELPCVFEDGLSGQIDNEFQERLALTFRLYLPMISGELEQGAALGYQTSVTSVNYIIQRDSQGAWSKLGTGVSGGEIRAIAVGADGSVYVAGWFTSAGGVANTSYIAKWDGSNWSALGTGANNRVYALAVGSDGSLYAGGEFTLMGGVANTVRIARWDGSAWNALGTGANSGIVSALAIGQDGTLYAAGNFGQMGGVASTPGVAAWNGAAWGAMGVGTSGGGLLSALAVLGNGHIVLGGAYTSIGGLAYSVARWDGAAWNAMSTGVGGEVNTLAVGPDGTLYAGGQFGGLGYVAYWNGAAWKELGGGADNFILSLKFGPDGLLYAGGQFTVIGDVTTFRQAVWNGSVWLPFIADLPGSPVVYALAYIPGGTIFFGSTTTGTATVESVTSPNNAGKTNSYPVLTFTGPGTLYSIRNYTTGAVLYFNLTLLAGETAVLDFSNPNSVTFSSNFRANLLSAILPGSSLNFFLAPGENKISVFIAGTTDGNTAATARWKPAYHAIDGALTR